MNKEQVIEEFTGTKNIQKERGHMDQQSFRIDSGRKIKVAMDNKTLYRRLFFSTAKRCKYKFNRVAKRIENRREENKR